MKCLFPSVLGRVSFYSASARVLFFTRCCHGYTSRIVVVGFSFLFYYFWTYNLQCSFNDRVFGFFLSPGKYL